MNPPPGVRVETTPEDPHCPACGRSGILSAIVPPAPGVAVLCATCDIDDPEAGPLIAYFTVEGAIDADNLEQGAQLVGDWLATARPKPPSAPLP